MEQSKIITIINESDGLPYGATFTFEYKTKEEFMKDVLSNYSIEELLTYCAKQMNEFENGEGCVQERGLTHNAKNYIVKALTELNKINIYKSIKK